MDTFANPDFVPMFADNITWYNDSVRQKAEDQCGDDYECLFDVASTNDVSVGMVTKDINIQLVNESNSLGKSRLKKYQELKCYAQHCYHLHKVFGYFSSNSQIQELR